ncbi:MAG: histidine kinase [Rikenellaceae bacterium]|nr:histidine kinase [Rikenellaceae bacterium]
MKSGQNQLSLYRVPVINLLAATALSLITNFSYVIYSMGYMPPVTERTVRGTMSDGTIAFNFTIQILFYVLFAFILMTLATHNVTGRERRSGNFGRILLYAVLISIGFYFLAPVVNRRGEMIQATMLSGPELYPAVVLKCTFTLVVSMLYGVIFDLIYQKQHVVLENEKLKNENLQTQYNMLINQVNPHFFFNSLNSLAMLVREKDNDRALTYIGQISDTFRYILQNGQTEMTTLREELKFLDAYRYLYEIRYEGKLFFDIRIDDRLNSWLIPALSLQPLIENAVKHNSITRSRPFTITITTTEDALVIANPIHPKLDPSPGTGIGLKNLRSRYILLTGRDIVVEHSDRQFAVTLPLIFPGT